MRYGVVGVLAVAVAAVSAAAPVASSTHFCGNAGMTVHVGSGPDGVNAAYLAIDHLAGSEIQPQVWSYVESNGGTGLQRGGVSLLGDADICQDSTTPDLLVF